MADQGSDVLPAGWTVEVKVRKSGKRDKYYFSPANGLKFNSKVEVLRHLDNAQNKVSIQRVADNVVVEKGIAEGLPQGWMKKTRVTTKGDTVRRDSYYIDPASGYAFRSVKDVDRYLQSGVIGRNAFRPKDSSDMESKANKFSSVGGATKPTLPVSVGLGSDLDMIANHQQVLKPACSGEYISMPISENISTQSVVVTELTSSYQLQAGGSYQKEGNVGLTQTTLVPGRPDEGSQEKLLQENEQPKYGTEKSQVRQRKRHKKEINLPRRCSKRLAGIQVDPVPELITRSRGRRAAVKKSAEEETVRNEDKFSNSLPNAAAKQTNALEVGSETKCKSESATTTMESPESCLSRHLYCEFSTPEWLPEKAKEEHGSGKGQECFSFWPQENHSTTKDNTRGIENGDLIDALTKMGYANEFLLTEILADPCFAFAVRTLTGITAEIPQTSQSQVSSDPRNSKQSETLVAAEAYGMKLKGIDVGDDKGGCGAFSRPKNYVIPLEHAGYGGIANKAIENTATGSSSEKTFDILSMDPCIEFAIKTLTGGTIIPLDSHQNPDNFSIQRQLSSSNPHHGEIALPSVALDNLRQSQQADYYLSQNFSTQNQMLKPSFVDPTAQHTRNAGTGNSPRILHFGGDGDDGRNAG